MEKKLFEEILLEYNKAYMYSWTNDKDIVDRFWKIKNLLGNREESDINWWIQNKNPEDFEKFVNDYENGVFKTNTQIKKSEKLDGAQIIYDDHKYWRVYFVTSYKAAKILGKNTKWCITGNYPGHEDAGENYFNDYIKRYNLKNNGYYFCFDLTDKTNRGDYNKYCILVSNNNRIHSIWNSADKKVDYIKVKTVEQQIQFIDGLKIKYIIDINKYYNTGYCKWIILKQKSDKLLLLFEHFHDNDIIKLPFNDHSYTSFWQHSDLRFALNSFLLLGEFLTVEEQNKNLMFTINDTQENEDYPDVLTGGVTKDKLFLLEANDIYTYKQKLDACNFSEDFWLRTPGSKQDRITYYDHYSKTPNLDGKLLINKLAVRPACWFRI